MSLSTGLRQKFYQAVAPLFILACSRSKVYFYVYYVAKIIAGVFCDGTMHCLSLAYVADHVGPRRRAAAFGLLSGVSAAGFVSGTLTTRFLPTASTFQVAAAVAVATALYLKAFLPDAGGVSCADEACDPLLQDSSCSSSASSSDGELSPRLPPHKSGLPSLSDMVALLTGSLALSGAAVVTFFYSLGEHGLQTALLYYLKAQFGYSKNEYANLLLIVGAAGMLSQLDRTLEDAQNITELSNLDLLPMVPPGFKSMDNGKGTNIRDTQFDEEPTGMTNSLIEPKGNGGMRTEHAATKLAESNHVMETAITSLDFPAQQANERSGLGPQNAGGSESIIDSSPLRRCSAFESLLPSPQPLSRVSNHQALFVKNSPMWHLVEAMHVFKELPQQPHFLPLQEHPPLLREGMALGLMVSFADLVKITMEASIDNSMEWFEDKIRTISYLEANGFSVQYMQSAMTELVKLKSERTVYHGEIGKLDSEFVEKAASSSRVGALLDEKDIAAAELEQELGRIRQESQRIAKEKEIIDAEVTNIKSALSEFEDLCNGTERKFKDVLAGMRLTRLT